MIINLEYKGTNLELVYKNDGVLKHVINTETKLKMMVEYSQVGTGYEMTDNNGYVSMKMCKAIYVRIMELDLFIPKFMFIPVNI